MPRISTFRQSEDISTQNQIFGLRISAGYGDFPKNTDIRRKSDRCSVRISSFPLWLQKERSIKRTKPKVGVHRIIEVKIQNLIVICCFIVILEVGLQRKVIVAWEVKLPFHFGSYDRPTDRTTTDGQKGLQGRFTSSRRLIFKINISV